MKWMELEQGRCRVTYVADIPGGVLVLVDLHDGNGHAGALTFVPGIRAMDLTGNLVTTAVAETAPVRREYSP